MNVRTTISDAATTEAKARALCDSPADFFGHSYTEMHSIAREDLAALQLEGLKQRFNALRDQIPMLKKLADAQGIDRIETVDDVVPLLFEHTMYKSYPPSLLENGKFGEINKFLTKLCTYDLTQYDVSKCQTIDAWMETMDEVSPVLLMHSSGTTGTMTFLPISKREQDKHGAQMRVTTMQSFGDDPEEIYKDEIYVIYPFFRYGGSGAIRTARALGKFIGGSEDHFIAAYDGRMSSDLLYLGAKIRHAQSKGTLGQLKVNPAMLARKAEYEKLQAEMPDKLVKFFEDVAERLRGKRIFFWGTQNLLFNITQMGKEKGLSHVFAPNSVIGTGGDSKGGVVMPDDWRERVCEFIGVNKIGTAYGMTEIRATHHLCSHGHYHLQPWTIPYVLDPDTSKVLPRKGKTTGRAAFFDLGAETRWGGAISGDEITIDWETPCPCGQTTVWAEDNISRYSLKRGGDDKITCAATEGAHRDAMDFLTTIQ